MSARIRWAPFLLSGNWLCTSPRCSIVRDRRSVYTMWIRGSRARASSVSASWPSLAWIA